jgi:hypothetical protein
VERRGQRHERHHQITGQRQQQGGEALDGVGGADDGVGAGFKERFRSIWTG